MKDIFAKILAGIIIMIKFLKKEWFFIFTLIFFLCGLFADNKVERYFFFICSVICLGTDAILSEIRKKEIDTLIFIKTINEETIKILKEIKEKYY